MKKQTSIECDECGKEIIGIGTKFWLVFANDGYSECCSKKCARKIYNKDFEEMIEEVYKKE